MSAIAAPVIPDPDFFRSPAGLEFYAKVGETDSAVVTVSNLPSATANLVISSINFSSSLFTRGGTLVIGGGGIAPGTSVSIVVTFSPVEAGEFFATLFIGHNDSGSPSSVTLHAVAFETPLPAAVWFFGTAIVGYAGISRWRGRKQEAEAVAA